MRVFLNRRGKNIPAEGKVFAKLPFFIELQRVHYYKDGKSRSPGAG